MSDDDFATRIKGTCPVCEQNAWLVGGVFEKHAWYGITPPPECDGSGKTFDDAVAVKGRPPWAWS